MVMLWNIVHRNYQNFFYYMGTIRLQKNPHQKHLQGTYLLESSLDGTKAVNPVI